MMNKPKRKTTNKSQKSTATGLSTSTKVKVALPKPVSVHSLTVPDERIYLEAIMLDRKPFFLHKDSSTGQLDFIRDFLYNGITYVPAEPLGYLPFEFKSEDNDILNKPIKLEALVQDTLKEWRTFIANDDNYKLLNVAYTVLTYILDKMMTVPYLPYFGDNETGKGQREALHAGLSYRANQGTLATAANVFQYSNDVKGLLIQDEFDAVEKNPELLALFKNGYKRGSNVLRITTDKNGNRIQHSYGAFSCKIFASNFVIKNKGVLERCIVEYTFKDEPVKSKFTFDDTKRFSELRKRFLIWKMQTAWDALPELRNLPFKDRALELYEPLLQAIHGTTIYDPLLKFLQDIQTKKIEDLRFSLTALTTKACVRLYHEDCPFERIRALLADYMDGTVVTKADVAYGIRTETGVITDEQIANEIKMNLGGVKARPYVSTDETTRALEDVAPRPDDKMEKRQVRGWKTEPVRLLNMVKKYHLEDDPDIVTELRSLEFEIQTSVKTG
jgi:hypothetical protein